MSTAVKQHQVLFMIILIVSLLAFLPKLHSALF